MTEFDEALIEELHDLRIYARKLTRNSDRADDLVQETALKALSNQHRFTLGTNLRAWLCTILRNQFFNGIRENKRLVRYVGVVAIEERDRRPAEQEAKLVFGDFKRAYGVLSAEQKEALALVAMEGFSYEVTAQRIGCPTGTVKSRVSRARTRLDKSLDGVACDDKGDTAAAA